MSSGAMLNVIISIGLYPIVTRLFTKEQFGGVGLFMAVVGVISLAGTSLYPSGLVIPKFKREFFALIKLSLLLALITVSGTILIIFFFQDFFISVFKLETIKYLLPLIPLAIGLSCIRDISVNWNVRNKDFKKNATSNVLTSGSMKLMNIGYALTLGPSVFGLVLSNLVAIVTAISTLGIRKMWRSIGILRRIHLKEVFEVGKKYKKYPINLLPGNLINRYTADLPIYLLTAYFSPAITGAFVLANTIMNIPLTVIGSSIASVFLQKANELYLTDPDEMARFADRTNRKMLWFGALAFGGLFGFGDLLFGVAFGKPWVLAGQFSSILSVYFVFKLIAGPMAKVFRVVGKEQYSLYVSLILAIMRVVGIGLGVLSEDIFLTIIYFTIANLIGYLITAMFVFKACRLPALKLAFESVLIVSIGFLFFYTLRLGFDQLIDTSRWLD